MNCMTIVYTANAMLPTVTTPSGIQAEQKIGQLLGATVYSNGVNVVVSHAHNENLTHTHTNIRTHTHIQTYTHTHAHTYTPPMTGLY